MFKKLLILFFIAICFTACTKQDNRKVIQFASWGSKTEVEIIKPILQEFERQNPDIKVDFVHIPQNYFQKIHLLFASNLAPDVIFINNLSLPIYASAGLLEELSPYFNTTPFYEKSLLKWNNKLYAIPRDVSNLVIYYNKDIFDKYNVAYPKSDWTLEDFLQTAQKLTHRPNVFGISFEKDPLFYLPYLMSEGYGLQDTDKLNFYADLRNKYHVAPTQAESASATMAQMFLQEKLAMHLSGRWLLPKYSESAKFNWDIVTFPHGKAGSVVPMDKSGWAIAKSSKHKQDAVKLVKFLSSKESITDFANGGLIVPAREDVEFSYSKPFIDAMKTSKITPVTLDYKEIQDELEKQTEPLFNPF